MLLICSFISFGDIELPLNLIFPKTKNKGPLQPNKIIKNLEKTSKQIIYEKN